MADRLLLAAREQGVEVVIAVNKGDLDPQTAEHIAHQYRGAGADVFPVCARTGEGVEALRARLRGHVHAVAGQSGAGKSTLLNALYGFGLQTGDVSQKIERGRHTTRHCELIPLEGGGMALDTPEMCIRDSAWDVHEHRVELIRAAKQRLKLDSLRPAVRDARKPCADFDLYKMCIRDRRNLACARS